MPMYFPDLKSVRNCALIMAKHEHPKKYEGLIPNSEEELPKARKDLAEYFRRVWKDEIQAIEIEEAVTEENYDKKMGDSILTNLMMMGFPRTDRKKCT